MTPAQLVAYVRESLLDDVLNAEYPEDNLWSNAELIQYVNEARDQACIRAELLEDDTTANLCVFASHTGGSLVLDERILYVKSAFWNGSELVESSRDQVSTTTPLWRTATGTPAYWFPELNNVYLIHVPAVAGELTLEVCRLPLAPVTVSAQGVFAGALELPSVAHLELGHWVAHRAYLKQDSETYDPQKSKRHYDLFEAVFGPHKSLRDVRDRRSKGQPRVNFARIPTS